MMPGRFDSILELGVRDVMLPRIFHHSGFLSGLRVRAARARRRAESPGPGSGQYAFMVMISKSLPRPRRRCLAARRRPKTAEK